MDDTPACSHLHIACSQLHISLHRLHLPPHSMLAPCTSPTCLAAQRRPLLMARQRARPQQLGQDEAAALACRQHARPCPSATVRPPSVHHANECPTPCHAGRGSCMAGSVKTVMHGLERRTCDLGGHGARGGLIEAHEGAPELAVVLPQRVGDLHDQPVVQQHQLRLLPAAEAAAEPAVPQPCASARPQSCTSPGAACCDRQCECATQFEGNRTRAPGRRTLWTRMLPHKDVAWGTQCHQSWLQAHCIEKLFLCMDGVLAASFKHCEAQVSSHCSLALEEGPHQGPERGSPECGSPCTAHARKNLSACTANSLLWLAGVPAPPLINAMTTQ